VVEDQRDFGQVLSAISIISNIIIAIASTLDATGQDSERNIQEYGQRKIGDRSNPADIRGESKNDSRTSYEKTVSIHFIAMNANAIEKSAVSKSNHPPNSVQSRTKKKKNSRLPMHVRDETENNRKAKQPNQSPDLHTLQVQKKINQPTGSNILRLNPTKHLLQKALQQTLNPISHPHRRDAVQVINVLEQLARFDHVLLDQIVLGSALSEFAVRLSGGCRGESREGSVVLFLEEGELVAAAVHRRFQGGEDDGGEGCDLLVLLLLVGGLLGCVLA
jgi:hypothetical protein